MAHVTGPCLSFEAAGKFAKNFVYQKRRTGFSFFVKRSPYDPKSTAQLNIRNYIKLGVSYWHSMGLLYQTQWNSFVS